VFRKRKTKRRNTSHCEARRSVRVVFTREPPAASGSRLPSVYCTNGSDAALTSIPVEPDRGPPQVRLAPCDPVTFMI
jgi:hypothetical protein